MSVLPSDAAATAMVGNPPAEVAECVTHLLSKLPDEDTAEDEEATSGRVVELILTKTDALSDEEKLSLALATLKSLGDATAVGEVLAEVLGSSFSGALNSYWFSSHVVMGWQFLFCVAVPLLATAFLSY